jgi:hypothetical protein
MEVRCLKEFFMEVADQQSITGADTQTLSEEGAEPSNQTEVTEASPPVCSGHPRDDYDDSWLGIGA